MATKKKKPQAPIPAPITPKVGRPTGYIPAYCAQLIEHMENGGSFESFGAKAHCHRDTLYEWEKRHPEFSDAKKIGKEKSLNFYETLIKLQASGKVKGNPAPLIFALKNMHGWRDRKDVEMTGKDGGPLNFSTMSDAELKAKIQELVKMATAEESGGS